MTNTEKKRLRVAFDVDETLWLNGNYGQGGESNWPVVVLFKTLQRLGCYMIVWSAGGQKWAEEISDRIGLIPDECRDKPPLGEKDLSIDFAIDDCEDLAKVTLFV